MRLSTIFFIYRTYNRPVREWIQILCTVRTHSIRSSLFVEFLIVGEEGTKSQTQRKDSHVYAKIGFIVQHNVVARPACFWTTQQAIMPSDFWDTHSL